MKITRNDSEHLVIGDFPIGWGIVFVGGAGFLGWLAVHAASLGHATSEVLWSAVGAVFLVLLGGLFVNRCVFDFDLRLRQLTWSRVGLFGRKGGTVSLGNITGCVVQTSVGDKGALEYRVALLTVNGELPLTATFYGGAGAACERVRAAIDHALGLAPKSEQEMDDANLQRLIDSGFIIDAVKFVREKRRCSLKEAKQIVDGMQPKD